MIEEEEEGEEDAPVYLRAVTGMKGPYFCKSKDALTSYRKEKGFSSNREALEKLYAAHGVIKAGAILNVSKDVFRNLLRAYEIPTRRAGGSDPAHKITIEARNEAEAQGRKPLPLRVAKQVAPKEMDPTPRLPDLPPPRPIVFKRQS